MPADEARELEIVYTLTPESELELHTARDAALFMARSRDEAGDAAGAGAFQLLVDGMTRVIESMDEEFREVG